MKTGSAAETEADLIPILAHELAQPLTAALGLARMIDGRVHDLDDATSVSASEGVIRNLKQLQMLLENLRLFSNMDSGTLPLKTMSVPMRELFEDAVEDFHDRFDARTVVIDCDPRLRINADVMLFRQVLSNLLANAVKFSEHDSTIGMSARPSGNQLVVTVRNEGSGFPQRDSSRIFDRAVRLGSSPIGLGFGLFVAKGIVDAHGGRIWAESDPGKGATFHVSLPNWPIAFSS